MHSHVHRHLGDMCIVVHISMLHRDMHAQTFVLRHVHRHGKLCNAVCNDMRIDASMSTHAHKDMLLSLNSDARVGVAR